MDAAALALAFLLAAYVSTTRTTFIATTLTGVCASHGASSSIWIRTPM